MDLLLADWKWYDRSLVFCNSDNSTWCIQSLFATQVESYHLSDSYAFWWSCSIYCWVKVYTISFICMNLIVLL